MCGPARGPGARALAVVGVQEAAYFGRGEYGVVAYIEGFEIGEQVEQEGVRDGPERGVLVLASVIPGIAYGEEDDVSVDVVEVDDEMIIKVCEFNETNYSIITKNDIVTPPNYF